MSRSKVVKVALRRAVRAARHPVTAVFAVAAIAAATVIATVLLVVIPALTAVENMPGQFGHAYVSYYNDVGRQFQQARQQGGGTP